MRLSLRLATRQVGAVAGKAPPPPPARRGFKKAAAMPKFVEVDERPRLCARRSGRARVLGGGRQSRVDSAAHGESMLKLSKPSALAHEAIGRQCALRIIRMSLTFVGGIKRGEMPMKRLALFTARRYLFNLR